MVYKYIYQADISKPFPKQKYYRTISAKDIAEKLGRKQGDGNGWWKCKCPCCHRDGKKNPTLSLRDFEDGRLGVNCWAGCAYKDVQRALIDRGFLVARNEALFEPTPVDSNDDDERRLQRLSWLDANKKDFIQIQGTPAEHYLCNQRGLPKLPPCDALAYWEEQSALVGMAYLGDDLVAAQLVYLNHRAEKIRKETRGFPKAASVRLPSRNGKKSTIIIAEGLETAISLWAAVEHQIEVWSVGGKQFLEHIRPPADTRTVILYADNDDKTDDETSGKKSRTFYRQNARVHNLRHLPNFIIARPEQTGWDANDFFRQLPAEEAITEIRTNILKIFKHRRKQA